MPEINYEHLIDEMKGRTIGFAGKMGSGKTTLAKALAEFISTKSNVIVEVKSFADPLRDVVNEIYDLDIKKNWKHDFTPIDHSHRYLVVEKLLTFMVKNNFDLTMIKQIFEEVDNCSTFNDLYRFSLQFVGTDLYRKQVSKNYWVEKFKEFIKPDRIIICDDVRYPNELKAIKDTGISVFVQPATPENVLDKSFYTRLEHSSETMLDHEDFKKCDILYINTIECNVFDNLGNPYYRYNISDRLFNYIFLWAKGGYGRC